MWTPAARAELARPSQPYATCLTDAEWRVAQAFLPAPARCGRPRRWPMRVLLDGVLYVLRTGCAWRHLPLDFPPWQTSAALVSAPGPQRRFRPHGPCADDG